MHHLLDLTIIVPLGIRILALVGTPIFHFAFHRVGEKVIHAGLHHMPGLIHLHKAFRFLPDAMMLGALIALHLCTEGGEGIHSQE